MEKRKREINVMNLQGRWTGALALAVFAVTLSSFQFGYHIGCVNAPGDVSCTGENNVTFCQFDEKRELAADHKVLRLVARVTLQHGSVEGSRRRAVVSGAGRSQSHFDK